MKSGEQWLASKEKRAFDILAATCAAPAAVVLGSVALTASAIEGGHTPLFLQKRHKSSQETITIPKIRTLSGPVEHTISENGHNHHRVAGALMSLARKSHADELPQLALLAAGSMTVVGPRPIVAQEYEAIMDNLSAGEQREWEHARTLCKPGLLNRLSAHQHQADYYNDLRRTAEADIDYLHHASLHTDLSIIHSTIGAIARDLTKS
jgi:lipopolysaccharide/colanic/teichoic acid biosynthesis glycosyltransferase